MTDERAVPLDDEEQNNRCRALEMMVLLRALLDATWRESDVAHWRTDTPQDQRNVVSRVHALQIHRSAARTWLLAPDNAQHVAEIAERAGLPDGMIGDLVRRFVRDREDPAPLHSLYYMMADRPGSKRFDFGVHFV